jgi:hypothetical protein
MSTLQLDIDEAVGAFKSRIHQIANTYAKQALDSLIAGAPAPKTSKSSGHSNGAGNGHSNGASNGQRAKGEKRSAEEIELMQAKFLDFVKRNSGLRIEQINKQLGTKTKDLMLPIRKLIADGDLRTKGEKRSTTYHAK